MLVVELWELNGGEALGMAAWMLYIIAVSVLVGMAALLLQEGADQGGGRLRWIWVGAFGVALVVAMAPSPSLGWGWLAELADRWARTGAVDASVGAPALLGAESLQASTAGASWWSVQWARIGGFDGVLLLGWAAAVLALVARWGSSARSVRRQLARWPTLELPEGPVMVSRATGPAVVGILRNRVVLPRWCLELSELERGLIVAHETEHLRARDSLLLGAATLLTVLMPWNVPFWMYRRRLQDAVEMDCDTRVLERNPSARHTYGNLLLTVAARVGGQRSALLTFSPHSSSLGRRITMLTNDQRGISGIRTLSLLAGALMLVTVSCLVPGPDRDASLPMGPETEVTPDQQGAEGLTALSEAPTFTPFTVAPEITNRMELSRLLHAEYPSELRDAGIGGRVIVHVFVDADGTVGNSQISEASGHPALDEAALRVAGQMEFAPARNQDEAVPVWISLPVEFSLTDHDHAPAPARDAEVGDQDERPRDLPAPTAALEDEPTFTPFTVAPEVLNRGELVELLQELYPAELRDAGVGGTARVHIFVDETGTVQNTEMAESSGHPALDEAAQEVAREFSFSPALNRDERVAVWIALPITFQTR